MPLNSQENIRRNFGMPQPNGYRKAMRFMRHANKFGLPIVTLVDTPGAYAGKAAEELGQVPLLLPHPRCTSTLHILTACPHCILTWIVSLSCAPTSKTLPQTLSTPR